MSDFGYSGTVVRDGVTLITRADMTWLQSYYNSGPITNGVRTPLAFDSNFFMLEGSGRKFTLYDVPIVKEAFGSYGDSIPISATTLNSFRKIPKNGNGYTVPSRASSATVFTVESSSLFLLLLVPEVRAGFARGRCAVAAAIDPGAVG
jgi:hypothetical protein